MALAAIIIAVLTTLTSAATLGIVLLLLGGRQDRFVTWAQMDVLVRRMGKVEKGNSDLFRYLEGLDDRTGGNGHQVLSSWVPGRDA